MEKGKGYACRIRLLTCPTPVSCLFFSGGRGRENERSRLRDRILGRTTGFEALRHKRVTQQNALNGANGDLDSEGQVEVVRGRIKRNRASSSVQPTAAIGSATMPGMVEHVDPLRGRHSVSDSLERFLPPQPPPRTAQVPRAGPERVALAYGSVTPWQSQTNLEWPGDAPPRYREIL